MKPSGGSNDGLSELAAILAEGWLRLQGSRAEAETGEPVSKPSNPLAISGHRSDVSNLWVNSPTHSNERGSNG